MNSLKLVKQIAQHGQVQISYLIDPKRKKYVSESETLLNKAWSITSVLSLLGRMNFIAEEASTGVLQAHQLLQTVLLAEKSVGTMLSAVHW
jgi:hypothetical protein